MEAASDSRLNKLVEALRIYDPERIVLFGSYARGEQDDFSDVDIMIIKKTEERFLDRLATVYRHVQPDFAMDVLVYTPQEFDAMESSGNPLIQRVKREGVVLYERN